MSREMIVERQRRRDEVLRALYELSRGRLDGMYTMAEIAARAGLSDEDAEDGFEFLERLGLAESLTSDYVNVTAEGVESYERSQLGIAAAGAAATHVSQHFYAPVGAVQSGHGSQATVHQEVGMPAAHLVALLDSLAASVPTQTPEQREEALELIADLRIEAVAPAPKRSRLKALSGALEAILTAAAGGLLAEAVKKVLGN
jgi:hypothetical protein